MLNQKMSADRVRSAQQVTQVVKVQGDTLVAAVQTAVGDPAVPVRPLLDALTRRIETAADALEAASMAHAAELNDDHGVRAERDELVEATYAAVMSARQSIRGVYGEGALKALGQAKGLPRRPDRVLNAAKALVQEGPAVLADQPRRRGLMVDIDELLVDVNALAPKLADAIAAVDREVREAKETLVARDDAMATHDAVFTAGAQVIEALFRLGGLPAYANAVRPSKRRPGRVDTLDTPSEADAAPPADGDA